MELAEVIADAKETVEDLVKAAYQAGVRDGRREMKHQFQERFAGFFDADQTPPTATGMHRTAPEFVSDVVTAMEVEGRAAPGSVKPTIERMLLDASGGLAAVDIAQRGGFKHNTVRGTLWTLGKEGFAEHRDGRWYAIKKDESSSSEPEKEPSVVE